MPQILVSFAVYCSCGRQLVEVNQTSLGAFFMVEPCPDCIKEAADNADRGTYE